MSFVPLSDEETRVIFAGEVVANLDELDADGQREVLNRLLSIVSSESPPSAFVHEQIANLDVIAVGDQCRLYAKVVDELPRGNTQYHVAYLFYVDASHDYPHDALASYSPAAERRAAEITAIEGIDDLDAYLDEYDALGESDLRDLLD